MGIDPAKSVSTPPDDEQDRVVGLWPNFVDPDGPGGLQPDVTLEWVEQFCGDYDQNGEVNASDLTPLGQYWAATVQYRQPGTVGGVTWFPDGDPLFQFENWRLARIDGDGNGQLNISDLTPIAQHWRESITGYRVYFTDSLNPQSVVMYTNQGHPLLPYTVSHAQAAAAPDAPVYYTFTAPYPVGVTWMRYWVVPWDASSGEEGTPSVAYEVRSDGNRDHLPTVVLSGTPASGSVPLDVTWDASGSFSLGGAVAKFEWDMDGDPTTFEMDSGLNAMQQFTYNSPGLRTMTVRVTDANAMSSVGSATVDVAAAANQSPMAVIVVDVIFGTVPFFVTFDPSLSSDLDGTIVEYRWDFDNDGISERVDTAPTIFQYLFTTAGDWVVVLTVVDNLGATNSFSRSIEAYAP